MLARMFERRKGDDAPAPSLAAQVRATAEAVEVAASAIDAQSVDALLTAATWTVLAVGMAACAVTAYYLTRD